MTSTSTLAGKRALVTGGSRGIGAAIARRLASREPLLTELEAGLSVSVPSDGRVRRGVDVWVPLVD
jgi:nucleoside-diphosphate-sugar epimerase